MGSPHRSKLLDAALLAEVDESIAAPPAVTDQECKAAVRKGTGVAAASQNKSRPKPRATSKSKPTDGPKRQASSKSKPKSGEDPADNTGDINDDDIYDNGDIVAPRRDAPYDDGF